MRPASAFARNCRCKTWRAVKGSGNRATKASIRLAKSRLRSAKLNGLEATLFSLYPSLEKLSVQGILATGQTAAELTPSANKLSW